MEGSTTSEGPWLFCYISWKERTVPHRMFVKGRLFAGEYILTKKYLLIHPLMEFFLTARVGSRSTSPCEAKAELRNLTPPPIYETEGTIRNIFLRGQQRF